LNLSLTQITPSLLLFSMLYHRILLHLVKRFYAYIWYRHISRNIVLLEGYGC
jgi:hypothetical protein